MARVGVQLPGEDELPGSPERDLVVALHGLYSGAGRPGLREIAKAVIDGDFRDTVSHEAVSDMLKGKSLPRWSKLECVVRQLADWNAPRLDPEVTAARFLQLWQAASGATSAKTLETTRARVTAEHAGPATPGHRNQVPAARPPATTLARLPARDSTARGRHGLRDHARHIRHEASFPFPSAHFFSRKMSGKGGPRAGRS